MLSHSTYRVRFYNRATELFPYSTFRHTQPLVHLPEAVSILLYLGSFDLNQQGDTDEKGPSFKRISRTTGLIPGFYESDKAKSIKSVVDVEGAELLRGGSYPFIV